MRMIFAVRINPVKRKGEKMTGTYQIKNNRYYAVLNVKDEFGKPKKKWISLHLPVKGTPKKAVKEKFEQIKQQYAYLDTTLENNMLFVDYIKLWLKTIEEKQLINEVTIQGYKQTTNKHIIPYFKDSKLKLKDVTPFILEKYYAEKCKNGRLDGKGGLSAKSIRLHHAVLSNIFKMAYKNNLISNNPIDKVELPKLEKYEATAYTPNEIKLLLDKTKNEQLYPLILITVTYGLRLSEVCGLQWKAIDFDNEQVKIQSTLVRVVKVVAKDKTKNSSSRRTYPMVPQIKEALLKVKEQQDEYKLLCGNCYFNSDYVFTKPDGKIEQPQNISKRFSKLLEKYGLRHIRFHDLRHSCASFLINQGAELKDIADWLGHSDIKMTANLYGHIYDEHKKQLSENFNILFE